MTLSNIQKLVTIGADARFGETIERLLLLLEYAQRVDQNSATVEKWKRTGLLDNVPDVYLSKVSMLLEDSSKGLSLNKRGETDEEWEDRVVATFTSIIDKYKNKPCECCNCVRICDYCRNEEITEWKLMNAYTYES